MYYAHSGKLESKADWQELPAHLNNTAAWAADRARPFGLQGAAHAAGLFHDLGKYTHEFQHRLTGANVSVDHSTAGARAMLGDLASGLDKSIAELIAYCIAGHHAGLPDRLNDTPACLDRRVELKLPALDPIWKTELATQVSGLVPDFARNYPTREAQTFGLSVMGRMIFSCLVDADFRDTEAFYVALEGRTVERDWPTLDALLPGFRAAFDAHMRGMGGTQSPLNQLRGDILAHVRGKAVDTPGLFTLTVPTGGGKTLASLGFALDHAKAHGHRRIIYAIPFTGAWIETTTSSLCGAISGVAPLAGAWIETTSTWTSSHRGRVAPLAGAWIETRGARSFSPSPWRRPSRRGVDRNSTAFKNGLAGSGPPTAGA